MLPSRVRSSYIPFVNQPNRVIERQKLYQAKFYNHVPTHLIANRSGVYYRTYLVFWGVGLIGTTYMIFDLIKGKQTTAD